jgi:hypothetical protein
VSIPTFLKLPPAPATTIASQGPHKIATLPPPHGAIEADPFLLSVNDERATRVADLLSDFRGLQHRIAAVSCDPPHPDDFYTEGYAALRQCAVDGQHILNVAADTRVPVTRGGPAEQEKAELSQVLLDSFARRHEAQKICMRQGAAMRWVAWRDSVLMGMRPNVTHVQGLAACDQALRAVSFLLLPHCIDPFSTSNSGEPQNHEAAIWRRI